MGLLHDNFQWAFCIFFLLIFFCTYTPPLLPFSIFKENEEEIKWESNCIQERCSTSSFGCFVILLKQLLRIDWFFCYIQRYGWHVRRQDNTENGKGKRGRDCIALNLKLLYGIDNNRLSLE